MRSSYLQLISFYSSQKGEENNIKMELLLLDPVLLLQMLLGTQIQGELGLVLVKIKILMLRKELRILMWMFKLLVLGFIHLMANN